MKSLIVYATKYGCAGKVAEMLRQQLGSDTAKAVNLLKEKVPPLKDYDTVIIGGSIYYGKIQKQVRQYMSEHLQELGAKRLGLFICAGLPDPAALEKELADSFPKRLYDHAVCAEVLGNEIVYDKLSLLDKLIMRMMKRQTGQTGQTSGQSNLTEARIERFANSILEF